MDNFLGILIECLEDLFFWRGFVSGVVVLFVLWCILRLFLACRRRVKKIVVKEEGGDFVISRAALREFLSGVVGKIAGAELLDVVLIKRGGEKIRVDLKLALAPNGNLSALHGELRNRVLSEIQNKLCLVDRIESVNMFFSKLPPSTQVAGPTPSNVNTQE